MSVLNPKGTLHRTHSTRTVCMTPSSTRLPTSYRKSDDGYFQIVLWLVKPKRFVATNIYITEDGKSALQRIWHCASLQHYIRTISPVD